MEPVGPQPFSYSAFPNRSLLMMEAEISRSPAYTTDPSSGQDLYRETYPPGSYIVYKNTIGKNNYILNYKDSQGNMKELNFTLTQGGLISPLTIGAISDTHPFKSLLNCLAANEKITPVPMQIYQNIIPYIHPSCHSTEEAERLLNSLHLIDNKDVYLIFTDKVQLTLSIRTSDQRVIHQPIMLLPTEPVTIQIGHIQVKQDNVKDAIEQIMQQLGLPRQSNFVFIDRGQKVDEAAKRWLAETGLVYETAKDYNDALRSTKIWSLEPRKMVYVDEVKQHPQFVSHTNPIPAIESNIYPNRAYYLRESDKPNLFILTIKNQGQIEQYFFYADDHGYKFIPPGDRKISSKYINKYYDHLDDIIQLTRSPEIRTMYGHPIATPHAMGVQKSEEWKKTTTRLVLAAESSTQQFIDQLKSHPMFRVKGAELPLEEGSYGVGSYFLREGSKAGTYVIAMKGPSEINLYRFVITPQGYYLVDPNTLEILEAEKGGYKTLHALILRVTPLR